MASAAGLRIAVIYAAVAALYIARRPLFSAVRGLFRTSDTDTLLNKNEKASRRSADELEELNG